MGKDINVAITKMLELHSELEMYLSYKHQLLHYLAVSFQEYQVQKLDYNQYRKRLAYILKGKTKDWWFTYYDSYILSLANQIEELNNQIFYLMFRDKSFEKLQINVAPIEHVQELYETIEKEKIKDVLSKPVQLQLEDQNNFSKELFKSSHSVKAFKKFEDDLKHVLFPRKSKSVSVTLDSPADVKAHVVHRKKLFSLFKKPVTLPVDVKEATEKIGEKSGLNKKELQSFEEYLEKRTGTIGFVKKNFFRTLFTSLFKLKQDNFGFNKNDSIGGSLLQLQAKDFLDKNLARKLKSVNINSSTLRKEAEKILEQNKSHVISEAKKPSLYVVFANKTMKPITRFLISLFPGFFKNIYNALRLANIKLLSNTYVNVLVLSSLIVSIGSFFFFSMFYFFIDPLPLIAISKSFLTAILVTLITIVGFTSYPFNRIKKRRSSIKTNLPFAINHMAAVASSGVSPVTMFELISETNDYGEICTESSRVVDYVHMFGYDLSTALQSVSATTPSVAFKDFIDGLVSNIHSGTEIHNYMTQKAEEAMTNYSIERQKYLEQVGTYSDIYTGILVAAPLFFITALSLVSMLGGEIGGLDVSIVIALGTYIVVPVLNIFFLLFLSITQPEY